MLSKCNTSNICDCLISLSLLMLRREGDANMVEKNVHTVSILPTETLDV